MSRPRRSRLDCLTAALRPPRRRAAPVATPATGATTGQTAPTPTAPACTIPWMDATGTFQALVEARHCEGLARWLYAVVARALGLRNPPALLLADPPRRMRALGLYHATTPRIIQVRRDLWPADPYAPVGSADLVPFLLGLYSHELAHYIADPSSRCRNCHGRRFQAACTLVWLQLRQAGIGCLSDPPRSTSEARNWGSWLANGGWLPLSTIIIRTPRHRRHAEPVRIAACKETMP